jgi:hypothetical protein
MKQLFYTITFLLISQTVFCQNDTLLHENFSMPFDMIQTDLGQSDNVSYTPTSNSNKWVNYDADGIAVGGNAPSQLWYWDSLDFHGDNLGVLKSQSWLVGFSPDNRNWLVLPALVIVDGTAELSWKSAPYQGPRYMDGYTVLVSTTTNDVTAMDSPFTDVLFQAAEMDSIIGSSTSLMPADYEFSAGYIHANGFTDSTYFISPGEDSTLAATEVFNLGLLEPHSLSLSAYVGDTIYIAFLHDSEDDNLIEIDDILVTGTFAPVNTNKINETIGLQVFPNPTSDFINLTYNVVENTSISASIYDVQGRLVQVQNNLSSQAGEQQYRFNVGNFATGNYTLVLEAEGQRLTKKFVVQ